MYVCIYFFIIIVINVPESGEYGDLGPALDSKTIHYTESARVRARRIHGVFCVLPLCVRVHVRTERTTQ